MPSFANTTIWLYRRIFGARPLFQQEKGGVDVALDGNSAVAVVEASIAEVATLGASYPADSAGVAWRSEEQRVGTNIFGDPLGSQGTEGPRGALAAAIGLTSSGVRATAFLSGPDIAAVQDLMVTAAGRHLPLVLHLSNRALASQGGALGSGHEACHLSADSGFFVLMASNVQEAVDFSLIARRVAELALVPGLVAMDGEQTALAAQNVRLPTPEIIRQYLGAARETIPVLTATQKLLFGDTRRRVPLWHDLDRPVLMGSVLGPESFALGAAAHRAYFDHHLADILNESFTFFATHTGRHYSPLSTHRLQDAQQVLIVQGSAIETAQAVVDYVRKAQKIKLGVLGVHCLRPFPEQQIAQWVKQKRVVAVLERAGTSLAAEPPLMREVRASIDRALETARFGAQGRDSYPAIRESERPRLRTINYGLGGLPLRSADLIALCGNLNETAHPRIFLGVNFTQESGSYPKRQVVLDALRRSYPDIAGLGWRSAEPPVDLRPEGAFTVAVHRVAGQLGQGLAVEAASFLWQLVRGALRSRPALFSGQWASYGVDRFSLAPETMRDPGDDVPVDLAILASPLPPATKPWSALREGGAILVESALSDETLWKTLPIELQSTIGQRQLSLYCLSTPRVVTTSTLKSPELSIQQEVSSNQHEVQVDAEMFPSGQLEPQSAREHLLGAMLRVLLDHGLLDVKAQRVVSARESALTNVPEFQRKLLLAAFNKGFDNVHTVTQPTSVGVPQHDASSGHDEAPMAVRHLGHIDDSYGNLPQFWDHIGALYCNRDVDWLTADPLMATASVPPLSSTFRHMNDSRKMLPAFEPALCTGCGECWIRCPDSAIGAIVIRPDGLINTGIRLAGADPLRPIAAKLAARLSGLVKPADAVPRSVGDLIGDATSSLLDKLSWPEDRKQVVQRASEDLIDTIGSLQTASTDVFFNGPENEAKGTGELLCLAVNADACKGCGLCISGCEPGALGAAPQDLRRIEQTRARWNIWLKLPETPTATIERISASAQINPLAALLLSRRRLLAVASGDGAEAGSGEKATVRLALAIMEQQQQPYFDQFSQQIKTARQQITRLVRETLANALPTEDLDALADGLSNVDSKRIDLVTLTDHTDAAIEGGHVDATRLRRLVDLAKDLTDLHWRLSEGPQRGGRAHLGLVVAHGSVSSWAGAFPYNPFRVPVTLDMTGDAVGHAMGLLEGQLRETTQGVMLLRKAALEIEQPLGAERERAALSRLSWRDLNEAEKRICPPIVVVGNDEVLGGKGFAQVSWLLGSDLPIKLLVLADLDLGLDVKLPMEDSIAAQRHPRVNLALAALASRQAFVVQTSIAESAHFQAGVRAAFDYPGPALIHVHAPSSQRHGFASENTFEQAFQAVTCRVFPLFSYDPLGEGVFGTRLSLDGNPLASELLITGDDGTLQTPVHWATREDRFATYFSLLEGDTPSPIAVADYLQLDTQNREGKTPFVSVARTQGAEVQLKVDPVLVRAAEERLHAWRTLQELAGMVTPFTARVQQQAREAVEEMHQAELEALKARYEQRIRDLEEDMQTEIAGRIRGRLLSLAGYDSAYEARK